MRKTLLFWALILPAWGCLTATAAVQGGAISTISPSTAKSPQQAKGNGAIAALAVTASVANTKSVMMERVRFWLGRQRPDMLQGVLDNLYQAFPEDPDVLALSCEAYAWLGQTKTSKSALTRLRQIAPGDSRLFNLSLLVDMSSDSKARLRQARQLARNGKTELAMNIYRQVFPNGPPEGGVAVEYWSLLARTSPQGRALALKALEDLARANPEFQAYSLALIRLRSGSDKMAGAAQQQLQQIIANRSGGLSQEAKSTWRDLLLDQPCLVPTTIEQLQEYVHRDAQDLAMVGRLSFCKKQLIEQQIQNKDPYFQARIAGLKALDQGHFGPARELLLKALEKFHDDLDLVYAVGLSYMRQGLYPQAIAWFHQGQRQEPKVSRWSSVIQSATFWGLMQQVSTLRDKGKPQAAMERLQQALALNPKEPYALATRVRLQAELGDLAGARQSIADLPAAARPELLLAVDQIQAEQLKAQADVFKTKGQTQEAKTLLQQALVLDPANPWLLYDLAQVEGSLGQVQEGDQQFKDRLAQTDADPTVLYAYALYQSSTGRPLWALNTLERVPPGARTANMANLQRRLWAEVELGQVQSLVDAGNKTLALTRLHELQRKLQNDPDALTTLAYTQYSLGEEQPARALLHQLLEKYGGKVNNSATGPPVEPLDTSWHLRYADFLQRNGPAQELQPELTLLAQRVQTPQERQKFAALQQRLALQAVESSLAHHEFGAAQQQLAPILKQAPDDRDALNLSQQLNRKLGQVDQAIADLQKMVQIPAPPGSNARPYDELLPEMTVQPATPGAAQALSAGSYTYKTLAKLLDQRTEWFSTAVDYQARSGSPGQSQFASTEIPIEWKMPIDAAGEMFFRTDQVSVRAGTLNPSDTYTWKTFGTLAATCASASATCYHPNLLQQSAAGRSYTVGYEREDFKMDLGTTPLGFPIENWVGGVQQKGDLGPFSWSLTASRRPITSTLLSYAGARDPATGGIWGGVLATGASAGLSLDKGETVGFWSTLGDHQITGTNVQSNNRLQAMAGLTWRLINREDRLISTGLTGMMWHFREDAGEFTWGQGGYYSPQQYRSIALPVTWAERFTRFSFVMRGSVFFSQSEITASPYYPTNPAYQNAALNPLYSSGSGPATGYSAFMQWEYQLTPSLFVGNKLEIERSPYYAPNSAILYLRYAYDHASAQPVALQPEPIIPTSQF